MDNAPLAEGNDGAEQFQYPSFPPTTGNPMEDEALQGLLMSWYYSGYMTGRYQAMKEMGAYQQFSAEGPTGSAGDSTAAGQHQDQANNLE